MGVCTSVRLHVIMLCTGEMRADIDPSVRRHALQPDPYAEPPGSRDPIRGRRAGARVHTSGAGRLFALVEVLSVCRLRADVYRTGPRRARHTPVSIHVPTGRSTAHTSESAFQIESNRVYFRPLSPPQMQQ